MPTCVVVDDHDSFRRIVGDLLRAAGIEVVADAADVEQALAAVVAHQPDLLLLDVLLGDDTALNVLDRLPVGVTTRVLLTSSRPLSEQSMGVARHHFVAKADLTIEVIREWASEF